METKQEKLEFAKEILITKSCSTCWHNRNSTVADRNHCAVHSCSCATAIFNHLTPTRWMSYEEGEAAEARVLRRSL